MQFHYQGRHRRRPRGGSRAGVSALASTSEPAPPPPQTASPTPEGTEHPREEVLEDCRVKYEALAAPMAHLGSGLHRLQLPCYVARRVREAANLRRPACQATVTIEEADRKALRQHSEEVTSKAMAIARRAMPARGGNGSSIRATRNGGGGRVICSICNGLVEETAFVQVSCSCHVHHCFGGMYIICRFRGTARDIPRHAATCRNM